MDMQQLQKQLCQHWPARSTQVARLLSAFGEINQPSPNLFIYGAPSTGKTSLVRSTLSKLTRRYAYVQCTESLRTRQLLSSIYTQLYGYKRKHSEAYAGLLSDNMVDFLKELRGVAPPGHPTSFIVLDNAQLLARSPVLRALLTARERTACSIAVVLISTQAWGSGEFEGHAPMPTIHFNNYTSQEAAEVLAQMHPQAEGSQHALFSHFAGAVVDLCHQTTRDVVDLSVMAQHLWTYFLQPLREGRYSWSEAPDQLLRKLFTTSFKERIKALLRVWEPGMREVPGDYFGVLDGGVRAGSKETSAQLELSEMAQMLLVAAYIASYNKPTLDNQVFDVRTRTGRVRGRNANMDSDRQVEAAKEAKLKGPHNFPLQRLLTILAYLRSHCNARSIEQDEEYGAKGSWDEWEVQSRGSEAMECEAEEGGAAECSSSGSDSDGEDQVRGARRQRDVRGAPGRQAAGAGGLLLKRRQRPWWLQPGARPSGTHEPADLLMQLSTLASMHLVTQVHHGADDGLEAVKYTCNISEQYAQQLADRLGLRLASYLKYA